MSIPRPWFAEKEVPVWFFKVNRRPLAQPTFLADRIEDPLLHVAEVLPFGEPVETGRAHKRIWRLGDRELDVDMAILTGQIGWERPERREAGRFDQERKSWIDVVEETAAIAHAPFLYDGVTTGLAVLGHRSFEPDTIAFVFTALLNRGEQRRGATAEWNVEPLLDVGTFRDWLSRTDVIERVAFVAKLPNPDILPEFQPLLDRLEARRAAALREIWEARDEEEGLHKIEDDPDARQMIAMAERGYGHVTARGHSTDGSRAYFNQRRVARSRPTPPLPSTVGEMVGVFIDFALSRLRSGEADDETAT
jgi:hypothetical protein